MSGALGVSIINATTDVTFNIASAEKMKLSGTGLLASELRSSGCLYLPATTNSSTGIIYVNNVRNWHNYTPAGSNGGSLYIGPNAGNFTMAISGQAYHCQSNLAVGSAALDALTTGYNNLAIGVNALGGLTTGSYNTAVGADAMGSTTYGTWNTAIGTNALKDCTSSYNTGVGRYVLKNVTQNYNTGLGYDAAIYIADGTTAATTVQNSVYIGANARASANSIINEIAIGYGVIGNGSNTVTLGSTSITSTYLQGSVIINETGLSTADLRVEGDTDANLLFTDASADKVGVGTPTPTAKLSVSEKGAMNADGGFMIKLTNKTGGVSAKGEVVHASSANDNSVIKVTDGVPDAIGVFYESGIADGAEAWVVVSGIADIYFIGSVTRGQFARTFIAGEAGYVIGQALGEAVPTSPFATDKHFCEIGHILASRTGAGLAKCVLHFN
jgi:hypothetical protein